MHWRDPRLLQRSRRPDGWPLLSSSCLAVPRRTCGSQRLMSCGLKGRSTLLGAKKACFSGLGISGQHQARQGDLGPGGLQHCFQQGSQAHCPFGPDTLHRSLFVPLRHGFCVGSEAGPGSSGSPSHRGFGCDRCSQGPRFCVIFSHAPGHTEPSGASKTSLFPRAQRSLQPQLLGRDLSSLSTWQVFAQFTV